MEDNKSKAIDVVRGYAKHFEPTLITEEQLVAIADVLENQMQQGYNLLQRGRDIDKIVMELVDIEVKRKGKDHPIRRLVKCAFIKLLLEAHRHQSYIISDFKELISRYPSFERVHDQEKLKLLDFQNLMAVAVRCLKAEGNKGFLLRLITLMSEGPGVVYVTGSGASLSTQCRVKIYEVEKRLVAISSGGKRKRDECALADDDTTQESCSRRRAQISTCLSATDVTLCWFPTGETIDEDAFINDFGVMNDEEISNLVVGDWEECMQSISPLPSLLPFDTREYLW